MPVLFFGDLDAYLASPLRVVTVGLNPSLREFPSDAPFQRFPLAAGATAENPGRYLDALSAYFSTDPYAGWFGNFEPLLNGMGTSYYDRATSTALHTDICSPVATDPTWNKLSSPEQGKLVADGGPLWHELLEVLRPNVVVLSVARRHLNRISFDAPEEWLPMCVFDLKADGAPRKRPYRVSRRRHVVGGRASLFVFCPASQTPVGSISFDQRRELGSTVVESWCTGR